MEKNEIRKLIISKRKLIPEIKINKNSFLINKKIIQTINLINKKIGIYFPINNEINFEYFSELKKLKIFFPKIEINKNNSQKNKMYFCEIKFNSSLMKINKNNYKINSSLIFKNKIIQPKLKNNILIPEIIFVPLVAFNKNCLRIGYGGGYYDRYLKNKKILKIGVASEFQKINFIPEKYDVQLDYIFTEKRIYRKTCKNIFPI